MKNKIQYVRILERSSKRGWHENLIDVIIPVVDSCFEDSYIIPNTTIVIPRKDCEPVQMKELDKDIDGNYLSCGDKVISIGYGWDDSELIWLGYNDVDGLHWVYNVVTDNVKEAIRVRKIPKKEKKENKDEKKANEICLNHENIFDAMEEYHKYKCSRTCADVKDEIDDVSDEPPKE